MMMNGPQITHDQAKALARLVHELRPDWDAEGVLAFIGQARGRASAGDLAVASIRACLSAHNRTPAVIPMEGPHWHAAAVPASRLSPDQICGICGKPEHVCRRIAALPDDGHDFAPLTGRPPNVDENGQLTDPTERAAEAREQLRALTSRLEPDAPADEPTPTPESDTTTEGAPPA